jgi:myo-inositol-1(or 4)-monophosphatase
MSRRNGAPDPSRLAAGMKKAAQAAGKILLRYFGRDLIVSEKAGAGLVTNADLESEAAAIRILTRLRPDFGLLTEESAPRSSPGQGRWIIDPLDGTTNYVHGFPMFCVSIAAEWGGRIIAGVIHHPVLRETYVAVRGRGAFLNGRRLKVSPTSEIRNSLLTTGFTYRKDEWLRAEMEAFERLSAVARAVRRPGSAALDLAYTARGVFDGFWERRLSPWDVAAGVLLVQEAGGMVTDFRGKPFQIDMPEVLASNSNLHPALLRVVSRARRPV